MCVIDLEFLHLIRCLDACHHYPAISLPFLPDDELVVFRQSQILPRYIFYYRVAEASPASQIIPGSARLTASASTDVCAARTILWVDDKAHGEHTLLMQMWRKEFPSIAYMVCYYVPRTFDVH